MQNRKHFGFVNIVALLLLTLSTAICAQELSGGNWQLTGQEVLLELSDPRGELLSGIYAWNPATPPTTAN